VQTLAELRGVEMQFAERRIAAQQVGARRVEEQQRGAGPGNALLHAGKLHVADAAVDLIERMALARVGKDPRQPVDAACDHAQTERRRAGGRSVGPKARRAEHAQHASDLRDG
jgi:hypothetical protein